MREERILLQTKRKKTRSEKFFYLVLFLSLSLSLFAETRLQAQNSIVFKTIIISHNNHKPTTEK